MEFLEFLDEVVGDSAYDGLEDEILTDVCNGFMCLPDVEAEEAGYNNIHHTSGKSLKLLHRLRKRDLDLERQRRCLPSNVCNEGDLSQNDTATDDSVTAVDGYINNTNYGCGKSLNLLHRLHQRDLDLERRPRPPLTICNDGGLNKASTDADTDSDSDSDDYCVAANIKHGSGKSLQLLLHHNKKRKLGQDQDRDDQELANKEVHDALKDAFGEEEEEAAEQLNKSKLPEQDRGDQESSKDGDQVHRELHGALMDDQVLLEASAAEEHIKSKFRQFDREQEVPTKDQVDTDKEQVVPVINNINPKAKRRLNELSTFDIQAKMERTKAKLKQAYKKTLPTRHSKVLQLHEIPDLKRPTTTSGQPQRVKKLAPTKTVPCGLVRAPKRKPQQDARAPLSKRTKTTMSKTRR